MQKLGMLLMVHGNHILAASNFDRIDIVYDSYLKVSIKELTRIRRTKEEPH